MEELLSDPEAMALLPELGPDQNILTYAVNFRHPDGSLNTSLELANRLNQADLRSPEHRSRRRHLRLRDDREHDRLQRGALRDGLHRGLQAAPRGLGARRAPR